jgi:dTMP kinase
LFVVIEGPNRAGKSTLIRELAVFLKARGAEVLVTREPGGTAMGEGLRAVLKNPDMAGGAFATALVFNGARKEHAARIIVPAVSRGAVVICDRYYMSTEIYQGSLAHDVTPDEREILKGIHRSFPQPDATVFVIPSAEVIASRGDGAEADRFEGNPEELAAYEAFAAEFGKTHPTVIIRPILATEGRSKLGEVLNCPIFSRWSRAGGLPTA